MKSKHPLSWLFILISACWLLIYNQSVQAAPELTIGNYQLVSSKRITRTVFEYTYKATVINTTIDVVGVSATLNINSPGITVVDNALDFGDVSSGVSSVSRDTFTIRQDRLQKFDPNALVWSVQYEYANLPTNPGSSGLLTVEGIDSDNDGVRDDVQIAIALKYTSNTLVKSSLTQFAKTLQRGLIKQSSNVPQQMDDIFADIIKATDCISHLSSTPKEDVIFIEMIMNNTDERSDAYLEINAAASGRFFGGEFNPETDCEI